MGSGGNKMIIEIPGKPMGNPIKIVVTGKPIAQARPRFVRRGPFVGTYNPQETEAGRWILEAKAQLPPAFKLLEGPLWATLTFVIARPKGHYGSGRNQTKLKDWAPFFAMGPKDLDNYQKFCLDCLNLVCYKDDSQIVAIGTYKKYGEQPRTEIQLGRIVENATPEESERRPVEGSLFGNGKRMANGQDSRNVRSVSSREANEIGTDPYLEGILRRGEGDPET